jgi:hypothetical protein
MRMLGRTEAFLEFFSLDKSEEEAWQNELR